MQKYFFSFTVDIQIFALIMLTFKRKHNLPFKNVRLWGTWIHFISFTVLFITTYAFILIYYILLTCIYECLILNIDCRHSLLVHGATLYLPMKLFIVIFDGDPLNNYQLRPVTESFPRTPWRSPDTRNPSQGRALLNLALAGHRPVLRGAAEMAETTKIF